MAVIPQTEQAYTDKQAIGIAVRRSSDINCQVLAESVWVLR